MPQIVVSLESPASPLARQMYAGRLALVQTVQQFRQTPRIAAIDLPAASEFLDDAGRRRFARANKQERPAGREKPVYLARTTVPMQARALRDQTDVGRPRGRR